MKTGFQLNKPIQLIQPYSNVDMLYGPYNTVEEAVQAIPQEIRKQGLTVGILNSAGEVEEYWWKKNIQDFPVKKIELLSLSLQLIGNSTITREEGETITAQFMVDGGAGIKKAVLYQVVNGDEVFVTEYTNIGKGSPHTFIIPNPTTAGIFTYRLKVLDSLDNYAITESETNYIEYQLRYGGVSMIYNLTQLDAIAIKNYNTVANVPFDLNISVRDESFRISKVCLTDSTDDNPEGLEIPLTPSSGTYIGNNTYYMPNSETLEAFSGKRCSVVVTYVEADTVQEIAKNLFKLLDISTIDIVPEYEGGNFYTTLPAYYTFQLQSAVENLSIVLMQGEDSDFEFERATVLSYRRFSLKIVPKNVAKTNAKIVINYYYTYNNISYSGTFTRTIGNILELPPQSYYEPETPVKREDLVYADARDYTGIDEGQYYKTISNQISTTCLASSFVLDLYCKINQQNDKSVKYVTITYGGVEVASITEDEISCANMWRNLYTDTPINEWTQIGIGVNLKESVDRGGDVTGYYHSIYINGMVVKTVLIDESATKHLNYDDQKRLLVAVGNGILVQKCFLYYRDDKANEISPNTLQNQSIVYNNYKSHKLNFEEPQDLPLLRFLRITDSNLQEKYFNLIDKGKGKLKHLTTFGTIGATKATSMAVYDPNYSSLTIESDATLFRQSVDIKKPAQKEYAVLCQVQWMGLMLEDVVVEVHTQGTSTLVYSIPNFKFTFWRVVGDKIEKYYPEFIQKEGSDEYYKENIYTAKADFMDSSHLNNTPTCNYYNSLIQTLIKGGEIEGSPSARNGLLDAIFGFPIVMEIRDDEGTFEDKFINIGSFMLNIDKTGNSLGFEVEDEKTGETMSCISFEGTSNDNQHGAAGRFDIPDGTTLKDYSNPSATNGIDEAEIREDYAVALEVIAAKKGPYDTWNGVLVKNLPYIKWCDFLSDGLEYRYPDSDIYKKKSGDNGAISDVMDVDHFIKLYRMWWWVYKSDTLSRDEYREGFVQHFDLLYCIVYFINLMTYAQTDNLGKNAMFDCWDGEHWYPRPYDLDSEAGLDNNGNDNIAPFVEIRPTFSLNYDADKADDWQWRADNYLIDDTDVAENPDEHLTKSTIKYGAQTYDRYHFSSNKSKLWINFYKNFEDAIETFYINIRNNYGYDPSTIISLCQTTLIDKLGTAQYNQDFQNKYLGNNDQRLAYGNRWYKFKKWLKKRFAFCDSYFGAQDSAMYNIVSRINYTIKVDAPQYIAQQYQGESNRDVRFAIDDATFNAGSGAATIITLLANQPSIFETNLFKYVVYNQGATNYNNLISLDVSGNQNPLFTSITSVTGESLDNLKYLNISNSAVQNLIVPSNVRTLVAENVNLNSLVIPDGCAVETISLKGSTFLGAVDFSQLPNLTKLDLSNCTFNQGVSFALLPQLQQLIMSGAIFNGVVTINDGVNVTSFDFGGLTLKSVSFNGTDLQIDTVNFHNTKFSVSSLNLNAISKNVKNLYFDNCEGLTWLEISDGSKFQNLETFSFYGSYINSLGAVDGIFDCVHLINMPNLRRVNSWNQNGTVGSLTGFTFLNTKVLKIANMTWVDGTGVNLFRDCQVLTEVNGTLTLTSGIDYMCFRCYNLATLPNVTIRDSVTSATYTFANANALSYSQVADIISKCTKVVNFTSVLQCKQFDDDQTISLNTLFGNNSVVTTLSNAFSCSTSSTYKSVTNKIKVTGQIPSTVESANAMFWYVNTNSIPYNILANATALKNASVMFANSAITFTGSGLPTQLDKYDSSVTLTNAVDKSFFSSSITSLALMFYGTNVITNDRELFKRLPNLTSTNAMFCATSPKKFSFTNSHGESEDIDLNVINMWAENPAITNISGCFSNVYNVYCTGLNFSDAVTSSKTVNISGLFGVSNNEYRAYKPITINIDAIIPHIVIDGYFAVPTNGSYNGPGVFLGRSVFVVTTQQNGEVFGKLDSISRKAFCNAILYLPSGVTAFNLRKVITSCAAMFQGCRLYRASSDQDHVYTVADRTFIDVLMPTNCSNYDNMFRDSSVLKSLPAIASAGASSFYATYQGCVINTDNLTLPADYFQICAGSLSSTSYMFCNNMYITALEYSSDRGLFEGCVNLSNVTYMFYGASFLHEGVPVNLFGETELTRIESLAYMFGNTSIIYDVKDNSHKWMDSGTIAPLTRLDSIQGMFYRNKINSSVNEFKTTHGTINQVVMDVDTRRAVIDPLTFTTKTITNISKLFEHTVIDPSQIGGFRFTGFTIGTDAFFSSSVSSINSNFVDSNNVSAIANANRMFYQSITGGRRNKTIDNLDIFVNNLVTYPNISKYNIAGNINSSDIPETYKAQTTEGEALVYSGFGLTVPANPESSWSNYGRYIYS